MSVEFYSYNVDVCYMTQKLQIIFSFFLCQYKFETKQRVYVFNPSTTCNTILKNLNP